MSQWPSSKARKVLRALKRLGWYENPLDAKGSSHRQLLRQGWQPYTWAFADSDELGPQMLSRIAKKTGLTIADL